MPHYIHTVFCKRCKLDFKIPRDDNQYFRPTERCYEMVNDQKDSGTRGCSGYVRWKGWILASAPQPILTVSETVEGKGTSYLNQLRQSHWADTKNMIAVLWDPSREEFVRGQCGTSKQSNKGAIPDEVWDRIPDEWAPQDMRFGRNCAEVNALRTLYNSHRPGSPDELRDYKFIAMDKGRNVRGPCAGCTVWLRHFHIQAYWNGGWRVP